MHYVERRLFGEASAVRLNVAGMYRAMKNGSQGLVGGLCEGQGVRYWNLLALVRCHRYYTEILCLNLRATRLEQSYEP